MYEVVVRRLWRLEGYALDEERNKERAGTRNGTDHGGSEREVEGRGEEGNKERAATRRDRANTWWGREKAEGRKGETSISCLSGCNASLARL